MIRCGGGGQGEDVGVGYILFLLSVVYFGVVLQ